MLFTAHNLGAKKSNQQVWFNKWILERLTYRYLSIDSGYSISTLKRLFKQYLDAPPTFQIKQRSNAHLMIDGTYFSNDLCLVLYQDNDIKYSQLYRFSRGEYYEEICEDLLNLEKLGVCISSITCDGHKATLKAIRKTLPHATLQRCVVHVHRMAQIWLRQRPKTIPTKELKQIIHLLPLIKTHNDKRYFINSFNDWYKENQLFVNQKTRNMQTGRWWYTHKNLKRTVTLIQRAIPNLFHYLDNDKIPKSTNGIESYFGHLKDNLSIHRGLSYTNRKSFIRWYLHLKNKSRG